MCLNTGTPKNINFSFETNGKLMALGVPILKHFRVHHLLKWQVNLAKFRGGNALSSQQVNGLYAPYIFLKYV